MRIPVLSSHREVLSCCSICYIPLRVSKLVDRYRRVPVLHMCWPCYRKENPRCLDGITKHKVLDFGNLNDDESGMIIFAGKLRAAGRREAKR